MDNDMQTVMEGLWEAMVGKALKPDVFLEQCHSWGRTMLRKAAEASRPAGQDEALWQQGQLLMMGVWTAVAFCMLGRWMMRL